MDPRYRGGLRMIETFFGKARCALGYEEGEPRIEVRRRGADTLWSRTEETAQTPALTFHCGLW
jgi:hypothetical protein